MRFFTKPRTHDDFAAEIQAHIDLETDRRVAEGLSPGDARAAAVRAFGNIAHAQERFFEASRWTWLEQLVQDVRYAWRVMRHSPAFVATAVFTLAVGLALVTVAFTIFNAYVLRPFAIRDPDGLHQIVWHSRDDGGQGFRWRDYGQLRERTEIFSAVIGEDARFVSSKSRPLLAASWVGSVLGVIALVLSVSGLYGVLTYTLSQRMKEIGIRMALGATAAAVVRLVLRQSTRIAGIGACAGVAISFAMLEILSAVVRFREISLVNVSAFAVGTILVLAAATLAAYQPARRASRVDPAQMLRTET